MGVGAGCGAAVFFGFGVLVGPGVGADEEVGEVVLDGPGVGEFVALARGVLLAASLGTSEGRPLGNGVGSVELPVAPASDPVVGDDAAPAAGDDGSVSAAHPPRSNATTAAAAAGAARGRVLVRRTMTPLLVALV